LIAIDVPPSPDRRRAKQRIGFPSSIFGARGEEFDHLAHAFLHPLVDPLLRLTEMLEAGGAIRRESGL
jgi:hypothetical protein